MHRKTLLRVSLAAFVVSLLCASAPLAANAVTSWGLTSAPPTILGYSHTARSGVNHTTSNLIGMTEITSSPAAPAGWMGVNCRIFQSSNDALKVDTGYAFTTSAYGSYTKFCYFGSHGTYYSWGVTALYNGSGNTYTYTYRSPDRTW